MKYFFLFFFLSSFGTLVSAQILNPVHWDFGVEKLEGKTYEVYATATMDNPWHIYSQFTDEGGPSATEVVFEADSSIKLVGKPKELGKLVEKYEEVFGVDTRYYSGKVNFVQKVVKQRDGPVPLQGSVTFMACTEEQCLPPKTVDFEIILD